MVTVTQQLPVAHGVTNPHRYYYGGFFFFREITKIIIILCQLWPPEYHHGSLRLRKWEPEAVKSEPEFQ